MNRAGYFCPHTDNSKSRAFAFNGRVQLRCDPHALGSREGDLTKCECVPGYFGDGPLNATFEATEFPRCTACESGMFSQARGAQNGDVCVRCSFYHCCPPGSPKAVMCLTPPVEIVRNTFFFRSNALHCAQLRARVLIPAECSAVS